MCVQQGQRGDDGRRASGKCHRESRRSTCYVGCTVCWREARQVEAASAVGRESGCTLGRVLNLISAGARSGPGSLTAHAARGNTHAALHLEGGWSGAGDWWCGTPWGPALGRAAAVERRGTRFPPKTTFLLESLANLGPQSCGDTRRGRTRRPSKAVSQSVSRRRSRQLVLFLVLPGNS